jgi:acetyl/propionyl-CoA carboxylase alpha subunit/acetyl-CoA carboxylase beta subunit
MKEFEKVELQLESDWVRQQFFKWLASFIDMKSCDAVMGTISSWKRIVYPRMSPPLFGVVRYYFSGLLPSLYKAQQGDGKFNGKITPRNIGIKDFWNRLDQGYKDLLIQNLLREYKKQHIQPQQILEKYFTDFQELHAERITANPVNFPGFRQAVEQALDRGVVPCGVITGIGSFESETVQAKAGIVISNTRFQAGAFDMASCEKVCLLLDECAQRKLPVILFISSAGMQTKEGAGSLFSMAVMNDRLTRFVKDHDLPVICFGFRDCVGGAQASFVTHLLVKTYYLSGAQIPFAGQLVVESHLPAAATLANYLSAKEGTMDGLVQNPFDADIDAQLSAIDPSIPQAKLTIAEVIARTLTGEYHLSAEAQTEGLVQPELMQSAIKRVLIHARGCTAARLIQGAHDYGLEVVLVQSDPDMESYPTQLLQENDRLICLGGNTPQESYLNAMSVIRIAEQEEVDAIHPGIGFLSESPQYARICREHGLNFVGPRAGNMDLMGNKSNAINTAKRLEIPVVPGSEGALADPAEAQMVAEEIEFPVLIKAAHGGGGKGIAVVERPPQLESMFTRMSKEALNAFGNGDLYLEKFIRSMRHLEVQVLRDQHGNAKLLGIRDCSVQRNYQKLIEEAAFELPEAIRDELYQHTRKLVQEIDYIGAGTVEFIYDLTEQKVYFMEMNTRLQVEHPVSEMVTRVDLVRKQFGVAEGEDIADLDVQQDGHAMELRINAERVELDNSGKLKFVPDPGHVTEAYFPTDQKVRVVQAVAKGSVVSPYYDSLVAQIIAWGNTRDEVLDVLIDYLDRVRIHGISTNKVLAQLILQDSDFRRGEFDTNFLKGFLKRIDAQELIQKTKQESGSGLGSLDVNAIKFEDSDEWKVLSPQMGGFYRSPSPEAELLVEEGSVINLETPLCLLESMKVFTELSLGYYKTADGECLYPKDQQFRVTRILAEDQQTVNQGDLLFVLEPVMPN